LALRWWPHILERCGVITDRVRVTNGHNAELKKALSELTWPFKYGSVKVQVRDGKATLITTEETEKLD
jgi:hypothetical protein